MTPGTWRPPVIVGHSGGRLAKDLISAGATAHVITADLADTGATSLRLATGTGPAASTEDH